MGMFDNLFNNVKNFTVDSSEEAYMNVMFAIAAGDGDLHKDEIAAIIHNAQNKSFLKGKDLSNYFTTFLTKLKIAGSFEVIVSTSIEALDPKHYQTVFVDTVDLVFSDGVVGDSEKKMIGEIATLMKLEESFASKVIEIISIKYR